jgi:hypothetical protein
MLYCSKEIEDMPDGHCDRPVSPKSDYCWHHRVEELEKAIIFAHEMLSGLSYTQDDEGKKYLCGNEYPWLKRGWETIKEARKRIARKA